jgi:hypothetical protein
MGRVDSECSALIAIPREGFTNTYVCRNGFPVFGSCRGTAGTPMCCREEACGRLYNSSGGKPKPIEEVSPHAG